MNLALTRSIHCRLGWVSGALLFMGLSFVLVSTSQLWTGVFNDSDDYMRMARVRDWLGGQGWYDLAQTRLSPGESFILPWSRLVDVPLAAVTLLFTNVVGQDAAMGVAAFLVPLLYFSVFCFLLPLLGRGMLPQRQGWLLLVVALCSFALIRELRPMRVDHHGVQILCALMGLVSLHLAVLRPHMRLRCFTGLSAALGLAIGAESFLWVGIATAYIGFSAAWWGGRVARDALGFAAGLLGGILVALPVLRPFSMWLVHDLALPALPHLVFAGLIVTVLGALHAGGALRRSLRLAVLAAAGALALGVLFLILPELLGGVYAANMQQSNQDLVLGTVQEAQSFIRRLTGFAWTLKDGVRYWPLVAHNLFIPLLAMLVAVVRLVRTHYPRGVRQAALWRLHASFLFPVLVLGLFWQSRMGALMAFYALLPVAWLWAQLFRLIVQRITLCGWFGRFVRCGVQLACLVGLPLPTVWAAAALQNAHPVQIILSPSWYVPRACDFKGVAAVLNDQKRFGQQPLTIMTSMTGGAELLYRTPHRVFAAPYDVQGNSLTFEFFSTHDTGAAHMMAQMHQIDVVLICEDYAWQYLDPIAQQAAKDAAAYLRRSQPVPTDIDGDRALVDHLMQGDYPLWLQPEPISQPDMHLFRVQKAAAP